MKQDNIDMCLNCKEKRCRGSCKKTRSDYRGFVLVARWFSNTGGAKVSYYRGMDNKYIRTVKNAEKARTFTYKRASKILKDIRARSSKKNFVIERVIENG